MVYLYQKYKDEFRDVMQADPTCVNISNAASWFFEDLDQEHWDYERDFAAIVPPWPYTWMEYRRPATINSEGTIHTIPKQARKYRVGMVCAPFEVPKDRRIEVLREDYAQKIVRAMRPDSEIDPREGAPEKALKERQSMLNEAVRQNRECYWITHFTVVSDSPIGIAKDYTVHATCYLDRMGQPIWGPSFFAVGPAWSHLPIGASQAEFLPFFFALSLLHCKNVKLVKIPVDTKVRMRREKRGIPSIRFKTLVVDPFRQQIRNVTEREPGESHIKKALHICRAHFKDYREKGLFGKYHDIYWWDMHVRGDISSGMVIKDYRIASQNVIDIPRT